MICHACNEDVRPIVQMAQGGPQRRCPRQECGAPVVDAPPPEEPVSSPRPIATPRPPAAAANADVLTMVRDRLAFVRDRIAELRGLEAEEQMLSRMVTAAETVTD